MATVGVGLNAGARCAMCTCSQPAMQAPNQVQALLLVLHPLQVYTFDILQQEIEAIEAQEKVRGRTLLPGRGRALLPGRGMGWLHGACHPPVEG